MEFYKSALLETLEILLSIIAKKELITYSELVDILRKRGIKSLAPYLDTSTIGVSHILAELSEIAVVVKLPIISSIVVCKDGGPDSVRDRPSKSYCLLVKKLKPELTDIGENNFKNNKWETFWNDECKKIYNIKDWGAVYDFIDASFR
jgi:hypothetical protein